MAGTCRGPNRARRGACLVAYLVAGAAGLLVLQTAFPTPRLDSGWVVSFLVLLGVSGLACASRARWTGWTAVLDASFAVELCALVLIGPLGAFAVAFLPDLVDRSLSRRRLRAVGALANLASMTWECVLGAVVLTTAPAGLTDASALPALFAAGMVMSFSGYFIGPLPYSVLYEGRSLASSIRPLGEALHVQLAIVVVGALTSLGAGLFGLLALLPLVLAVQIPQLLLIGLTRFADVRTVEPDQAMRVYAAAISDVLALPRAERRILEASLDVLAGRRSETATASTVAVTEAVLHRAERWDGGGEVAGLTGEWIPRPARIIAVAAAWSQATAKGTAELDHDQALLGLRTGAGTRFDPDVVAAAGAVVEAEALYSDAPCFLPRLHRTPVPRAMRRGALPRMLRTMSGA